MTGTEELVMRADADGVATLTLNRPSKLNALDPAVFAALRSHLDAIATETDQIGCVVLTGSGRAFSAGHDLGAIASKEHGDNPLLEPETVDAIETLPQPVIAKIHGYCFTGALELALACDLLLAADDAILADTHGAWGLAPAWGMSVRLPERVGRSRAKELMYTSRRITGAEAERIGLVDRAVPAEELDEAVRSLAAEINTNSWGTNRIYKRLIADVDRLGRAEALLAERRLPYGLPEDMSERMSRRS